MADKIKVGIIGCGGIANGKHLPSLKSLKPLSLLPARLVVKLH